MRHLVVLTMACVALSSTASKADDKGSDAELAQDRQPWAQGVPESKQDTARKLYTSGNDHFKVARHAEALVLYNQALKHWNHPRIRINAAAASLELERLLDAATHIAAAAEYRDDLSDDDRAKMDKIIGAVDEETGMIAVRTEQAGVIVTVDGVQVLVGPGSVQHRVLPGKHVVVAQRKGLRAETQQLEVVGGASVDATPVLYVTTTDWRWAKWKPWAVVGLGAAVAAVGAPILLNARSLRNDREELELECLDDLSRCVEGGDLFPRVLSLDSKADTRTVVANSLFVAGGVVVATGVVLAIINRPSTTKRVAGDNETSTTVSIDWTDKGLIGQVSLRF